MTFDTSTMSVTVPLLDDDTVPFGEEDELNPNRNTKNYPHPYIVFFHLCFRGSALLAYILCGFFSDSYITSFVVIVLLLSCDFWVVKNITGRILVGLRWWNFVDDEGNSQWIYESKSREGQKYGHSEEVRIFWMGLIISPVMFFLFFIVALFGLKLKWLLVVMIALALNGANLYGYIKCHFGANKDVKSAAQDFVKGAVMKNAVNSFFTSGTAPPNAGGANMTV